jgi:hypothetical protein
VRNNTLCFSWMHPSKSLTQHLFVCISLSRFVKRMNSEDSRSGHQNPHTVSRPAFVAHFLDVLDQTMTLKISPEEAAATYDEIVASVPKKILYEKMLYHSSLSYFLSETEIWTLIKVRNMLLFFGCH